MLENAPRSDAAAVRQLPQSAVVINQPVTRAEQLPAPQMQPSAVVRALQVEGAEPPVRQAVSSPRADHAAPPAATNANQITVPDPQPRRAVQPARSIEDSSLVSAERVTRPFAPALPPQPAEGPERVAPAIHVTIGRVEIRANVAAPPGRKTTPAKPALNLDDYLQQRRGVSRE